jgi:hypothetical protein
LSYGVLRASSRRLLLFAMSERWRDITTAKQAVIFSARARIQRMPPQMTPSQPSMTSVSA